MVSWLRIARHSFSIEATDRLIAQVIEQFSAVVECDQAPDWALTFRVEPYPLRSAYERLRSGDYVLVSNDDGAGLEVWVGTRHNVVRIYAQPPAWVEVGPGQTELVCADEEGGEILLRSQLAAALALLERNRGAVVLHAGLVRCGDQGMLVVGPKGSGKSLTCLLAAEIDGLELEGDEACALDAASPGRATALPRLPAIHAETWERYGIQAKPLGTTAQGKLLLDLPRCSRAATVTVVLGPCYRTGRRSGHERRDSGWSRPLISSATVLSPRPEAERAVLRHLAGLPCLTWYHGDDPDAARTALATALGEAFAAC